MRFGVSARPGDERRLRIVRMVLERLEGKADVVVTPELLPGLGRKLPAQPLEKMDVDVLVTVGGDGTILHALQHCDAPVFGINAGEIGFLTEIEPIELGDGLARLLARDFFVEERAKLATWVNGERLADATNDSVLKTPRPAKLLHFELKAGTDLETRVRADGLVVATPTGSTSYAMSAGGPIVDPSVEGFLVVPIAPFSLASRPMVFPPKTLLELRLLDEDKPAVVVLDGQSERDVAPGDTVKITVSERRARFARFRHHFYARVAERLG